MVTRDGKIDAEDLGSVLKQLGYQTKRSEIHDMIWEIDDDCDKCVNWHEFQAMFYRCRGDKTGYEPRRFFNVVEFLLNDKDDSGSVSLEEATQILYLRFGKYSLDAHLQEIFGSSDVNNTRDLSLTEFLSSMEASHKDQIHCNASKNLRTPTS